MKRSKIFLGVTTALLAVAGVAAAKHYQGSTTRFYITQLGAQCLPVVLECTKFANTNVLCTYVTEQGAPAIAFTNGPGLVSAGKCTKTFKYNPAIQ